MSRPQSSDVGSSQIACLESALSELSQPISVADSSLSVNVSLSSSQILAIPHVDDASSTSLHKIPDCSTSSYNYFGETQDGAPHGFGIRIYSNSGSVEKGQFSHGVFEHLGEFISADYGTLPSLSSLHH